MDGNGRWANARGLPRTMGHKAGLEAVRRTVKACPEIGIRVLTLYAFSSENWSRPAEEVRDLMGLMRFYIRRDLADLNANGVRIRILGSRDNLQDDIVKLINQAEEKTATNSRFFLNIAFNYGGRDELVRAVNKLVASRIGDAAGGECAPITENEVSDALDTAGFPDPDLIIRTSGEQRLSNFLPWQSAYSEFVFLDGYWPDFDRSKLVEAVDEYLGRDRRYGSVEAPADIAL